MQRKYKITIHLKLYNIAAKNSICCQSKFRLVFLKMIFLEKNENSDLQWYPRNRYLVNIFEDILGFSRF